MKATHDTDPFLPADFLYIERVNLLQKRKDDFREADPLFAEAVDKFASTLDDIEKGEEALQDVASLFARDKRRVTQIARLHYLSSVMTACELKNEEAAIPESRKYAAHLYAALAVLEF